jgi:O-antigen/teichoic acid export membrane protein
MNQKDGLIVNLLTIAKKATLLGCVTAFLMGTLLVPAFAQNDASNAYEQMGEAIGYLIIIGVIIGLAFLIKRLIRK